MTNIELTQKVAHLVVSMATQSVVVAQIEENTDIDTDGNIPVHVGAVVIGELVARRTDRITKPIIERAANRIIGWRNRKSTLDVAVES